MKTTHEIEIDLLRTFGRYVSPIEVMQDDQYSRDIKITCTAGSAKPDFSGCTAEICFAKPDGTGGKYEALPNNETAYTISGNTITIKLAPQVCTVPGDVQVSVALISGSEELHTFAIALKVHKTPGLQVQSANYFKIAGSVADSGWPENRLLGTDELGNVVSKPSNYVTTDYLRPYDDAIRYLEEEVNKSVRFTQQELSEEDQASARQNIGAVDSQYVNEIFKQSQKPKIYERIATITVEENSQKSMVVFNADSSGNPLELTDFIIRANAGFADGSGSTLCMAIDGADVIANGKIPSISNTPRSFNIFFRNEFDGCRRAEYTASTASNGSAYNAQAPIAETRIIPQISGVGEPPISRIELYTRTGATQEWVVGSTFELWGVKA